MLRLPLAPLLCALCAQPAAGGAWMREPGRGFASASATLRSSDAGGAYELGYYGDIGVMPWLTLGADLNDNNDGAGHVLLFARLPLLKRGDTRVAAEAAAGGGGYRGDWRLMHRLTLSFGHEFAGSGFSGWASADAAYEQRTGSEGFWKLDAAIGLNRPGRTAPLLQIETAKVPGQPLYYTITPSLRFPLRGGRELVAGLEQRRAERRSLGLKFALWHKF